MRRLAILFVLLLWAAEAMAGVRLSGGADISSAYLWRGERVCGLHVYPELALTAGNFTFMAYGYFPFDGSYAEKDIEASYRIKDFSVHLACYFVSMPEEKKQLMEAALCWSPSALPLRMCWFTFFYGDHSSYLQTELYHRFGRFGTLSGNLGLSVFKGPYTGYREDVDLVHCEIRYSKDFELGRLTVPLSCGYLFNPYSRDHFVNLSAGLRF